MEFGQTVTSANTNETEVQFSDTAFTGGRDIDIIIYVDPTNSGTIQFSVEKAIDGSYHPWPAGSKIAWKINNYNDLRYKASATGQKFVVTRV